MKVLANPEATSILCNKLAEELKGKDFEIVVGPSLGGVIIAFEVAKYLGLKCAFADKVGDKRAIRPTDVLRAGMKVGLVDDILTTGKSIKETLSALEELGAEVVVIGVILDRSGGEVDLGIPLVSLASMKVEAYKPEECPLCKKGIPLEVYGSATRKG
jgi:orotate phosphoribosyltransferase